MFDCARQEIENDAQESNATNTRYMHAANTVRNTLHCAKYGRNYGGIIESITLTFKVQHISVPGRLARISKKVGHQLRSTT